MFENRVLRRILGPKRGKTTGSGEAVPITKYYSGNQIEKNEMGGACSTYGGKERYIQDFGGET
jgi:hypothetical protein